MDEPAATSAGETPCLQVPLEQEGIQNLKNCVELSLGDSRQVVAEATAITSMPQDTALIQGQEQGSNQSRFRTDAHFGDATPPEEREQCNFGDAPKSSLG